MRLWLDEMVPAQVAVALRGRGFDVLGVQEAEQKWAQGLDDEEQLRGAVELGRALVTYNLRDFVPLSREWAEAHRHHLGILLVHERTFPHRDPGRLVDGLRELLERHAAVDALADVTMFLA